MHIMDRGTEVKIDISISIDWKYSSQAPIFCAKLEAFNASPAFLKHGGYLCNPLTL